MNDKIVKLLAKLDLQIIGKDESVNWAISCLESGYDSKSLRMLASMNNSFSSSEIDAYLNRSLQELGWDKFEQEDYLMKFAEITAQETLDGKIKDFVAAQYIYTILKKLNYPPRLGGWFEIDEMIWAYNYFIETGEKGYFYRDKSEIETEIRRLSKELLESK